MISAVGGLGGGAGNTAERFSRDLIPSPNTVEADEEDVEDSRTDERLCCCRNVDSSGVLCLVTGGLLCSGLVCRILELLFVDRATPGE